MRKYVIELMDEMNGDPTLIEQYARDPVYKQVLTILFEYAFLPEKKWLLPEGEPPFKAAAEPMGMTETNLYAEFRRFYVFCRSDLKPLKRESLFINLLEGIHPKEAEMLIAVKDQKLHKLYTKITKTAVAKAGFIPNDNSKSKKD
jgi:Family of unknown function (DUF6433)